MSIIRRLLRLIFLIEEHSSSNQLNIIHSPFRFLAYFGQDCTDSAVIRRIEALEATGYKVLGFTFRRYKFNRAYRPHWENIALGVTIDRHYFKRVIKLLCALWLIWQKRARLQKVSFFYARNLDMALLAWWGRLVSGAAVPLIYEVLDVQRAFVAPGIKGMVFRMVERWVLSKSQMLVVSSPAFVTQYFKPKQKLTKPVFLLENKILERAVPLMKEAHHPPKGLQNLSSNTWVIGWFGTLRCLKSLDILIQCAKAHPENLLIYLRGFPTETGLEPFLNLIASQTNIIYEGEYSSPQDLPSLYSWIDFAWCFDFLDEYYNSEWLIPNRYYDSGYFNVPTLAKMDTQTGDYILKNGMGWVFEPPYVDSLTQFLKNINRSDYHKVKQHMKRLPRSLFCEKDDTFRLIQFLDSSLSSQSG